MCELALVSFTVSEEYKLIERISASRIINIICTHIADKQNFPLYIIGVIIINTVDRRVAHTCECAIY